MIPIESLLIVSLFAFSFWWFLQYSPLTEFVRRLFNVDGRRFISTKPVWYTELYKCVYCSCWWIGFLFYLIEYDVVNAFLLAFVIAIISYLIYLLEKKLIR